MTDKPDLAIGSVSVGDHHRVVVFHNDTEGTWHWYGGNLVPAEYLESLAIHGTRRIPVRIERRNLAAAELGQPCPKCGVRIMGYDVLSSRFTQAGGLNPLSVEVGGETATLQPCGCVVPREALTYHRPPMQPIVSVPNCTVYPEHVVGADGECACGYRPQPEARPGRTTIRALALADAALAFKRAATQAAWPTSSGYAEAARVLSAWAEDPTRMDGPLNAQRALEMEAQQP